jgi:hypothetical protein
LKVVLDIDVLVSGLLNPPGTCGQIIDSSKRHFPARECGGVNVLSPREFLDLLAT